MTSAAAQDRYQQRLDALRAHHARHGAVPSIQGLAELWGYASKSAAARLVERMLAEGVLARAPGRRLALADAEGSRRDAPTAAEPDTVDAAVARWRSGYSETPAQAYDLTVRVLRLAHTIEAGIERTAQRRGLSVGELLVLDALYRAGPPHTATPTQLKRLLLLSLAGVGKRVDRLTALGLVERLRSSGDGRSLPVRLTEQGHALLRASVAEDVSEPHIAWALALEPEARAEFLRLLRDAQAHIEAAGGEPD
jgi:DNA-binding MarR family transcriptional regulator